MSLYFIRQMSSIQEFGFGFDTEVKKAGELQSQIPSYPLNEIGNYKPADWSYLAGEDFNPDNISIETYVRMINEDAQVGAGATLYKLALLSKPWDIKFPEGQEPPNAKEIIDFLKWNFNNVNRSIHFRGGLRGALEELIEGPLLGFAVAEPVYDRATYQGQTKVIMCKFKVLPQETIKFWSDRFGNIEKVEQISVGTSNIILEPLAKFVIWPFNMRAGNWYGRPLLKRAYKHWYIKEFLIKKWNIFLERKAIPILVGKTRPNNIKNLNKFLAATNEKSVVTIDKSDEVDVLQSKAVSSQFKLAIQYHDIMIFRGMLTPTLLLGQEDVGARALGDTHFQVFMWVVDKMKEDVTHIMDNLIFGLVRMNYANVEIMPHFIIPELSTEDRDKFANVVKELITVGVLDPDEDWIRQRLGFPINPSLRAKSDGSPPEKPNGEETPEEEKSISSPHIPDKKQLTNANDVGANLVTRIQPEKMRTMLDASEDEGVSSLQLYIESFEDAFKAQARTLLEGYDPESPDRFDFLSKLKRLKAPKNKKMSDIILGTTKGAMQRITDYYIQRLDVAETKSAESKQFEGLDVADSDTLKVLTERAFTSAGIVNEGLLDLGKQTLITGIQSGMTVEDMIEDLERSYPSFSENRLRTIVRTNVATAANQGMLEVMRNTNGFVQGVMYQAIIDRRTTQFCEDHNGETLPLNDPRVDAMTPPNHFQCRSYWIPVTIIDPNVDTNTWENAGSQPQAGFGINPERGEQ